MLGLGGFGQGNYGMGIELGFKYPAKAGMKHAQGDFRQLRAEANRTDKAMASSMAGMQRGFKTMALGGAIGAAAIGMSALDMHTEQARKDVESLGYSAEESAAIFKRFHNLVRDEDLPVPFRRATDVLYSMGSAGIKLENANSVMRHSAYLAKGAIGDITDAIPIMGIAFEQVFDKMDGTIEQKFRKTSDVFASTVKTYRTTLPGISKEFSDVAGYLPAHWGLEKSIPLIGTLIGTMMGQTGTGVKAFITGIPKAQTVLGMNFVDSQGREKDPLEIIRQIKEKFGEIDASESMLLEKAFTKEGMGAIKLLLNLEDRYVEGRHAALKWGDSENMGRIRADSLAGALENLSNKFLLVGDTIGENGLPLKEWVNSLSDSVAGFDKFLGKNTDLINMTTDTGALAGGWLGVAGAITSAHYGLKIMSKVPLLAKFSPLGLAATAAWVGGKHGTMAAFKVKNAFLDSLATKGKSFTASQRGSSFVEAPAPAASDHFVDKIGDFMFNHWTQKYNPFNPAAGGISGWGLKKAWGVMGSDALWRSDMLKFGLLQGPVSRREKEIAAWRTGPSLPGESLTTSATQQAAPQQVFTGKIQPTLVIHLNSDDPDLDSKVKDRLDKILQEATFQAMRRGEAPTELAQ